MIYQQDAEVVNLRVFSNFVSATHRLPTFATREQQPRRARFRSYQPVRAEGHFQFPSQRTRHQFWLFVSVLALPRWMERNGNRDIRRDHSGAARTVCSSRAANQAPSRVNVSYCSNPIARDIWLLCGERHRRKRFEVFAQNHNVYFPGRNGSNLYDFEDGEGGRKL